MRTCWSVLLLLVTTLLWATLGAGMLLMPDRYCLACLCSAATNCAEKIGCRRLQGQTRCGPFLLTKDAWRTARLSGGPFGRRFRFLNFRTCALDAECSAQALSRYLAISAADCDGDGTVTCADFGVLAREGHQRCSNRTFPAPPGTSVRPTGLSRKNYYSRLGECMRDVEEMLATPPPTGHCSRFVS